MLILTIAFYEKHCKPLLELGFTTWADAFRAGIITERECHIGERNLGFKVPNLKDFLEIQENSLTKLRRFV